MKSTAYTYNAEGLRISKGDTRYHLNEAGQVILETENGSPTARMIWTDKPLARKIDSNYYYYIYNAHNDVVAMVDEQGTIVKTYEYSAWGTVENETGSLYNPVKYAGEYQDMETGLIYLRARYYDPINGRFTQQDPIRDGKNWYIFCNNNPVNFIDPTGLRARGEIITNGQGSYNDIWIIQGVLSALNFKDENGNALILDGKFGKNTNYAVKAFQKAHGLVADGLVGDKTWDKMMEVAINSATYKQVPTTTGNAADLPGYDDTNDGATINELGSFLMALPIGLAVGFGSTAAIGAISSSGSAGTVAVGGAATTTVAPGLANTLNHIFGNAGHNLQPLLNSFNNSQIEAYNAVQKAAQFQVDANNLTGIFKGSTGPILVEVNGFAVGVYGNVIDGVLKISTFFIQ